MDGSADQREWSSVLKPTRMEREFGAFQAERSKQFLLATQGRGKPMIYGTGKPPEKKS